MTGIVDPPPPAPPTAPPTEPPRDTAQGPRRFAFLDRRAGPPAAAPKPAAPPGTSDTPGGAAMLDARHRATQTAATHKAPLPQAAKSRLADPTPKSGFATALVLIALISALPVGSNRPLAWAFLTGLIGLTGAAYMLATRQRSPEAPLRLGPFLPLFALAALQPLWGLVQALPLGGLAQGLALPVALPDTLHPATISLDPRASLLAALRMATHIAFFALALDVMTRPERLLRSLRGLFIGITLTAAYGMTALTVLGDIGPWGAKTEYLGHATGPFVNRNAFAAFLGMGLVLGVALVMELRARPKMRRPRRHGFLTEVGLRLGLHGLALAMILVALLATGSRMGLLASLSGSAVTFWLMHRAAQATAPPLAAPPRRRGRAIVTGLLALGLVLAAASPFLASLIERSLFAAADTQARQAIFGTSLGLLADRPLVGFGLDAFPLAFELARPDSFRDALIYTDAHSTYLENWVEGGLIFGSVPLIGAGLYIGRLRAALRARRLYPAASAAAAGVLCLAALHSLVDFPFEIEANVLILCLICAMGISPLSLRNGSAR